TGTVTQSGVGEDVSVPVPVEVQFGRARPLVHWVRTGDEPATFTLNLKQAPTRVALDPSGAVLAVRK
ncbi:MAG: hypothetical protein ACRD96_19055, partial [Bryobacteraceae bacterium]